ncbi:energy transducer TonB [Mucilaginibacter sp.]|uniref:energy transducer TonB n=1 Tax=Mucilaginibacter sp. TaxID=1882438 RepID=UPI003D09ED60
MKRLYPLFIALITTCLAHAQDTDTIKRQNNHTAFTSVEKIPEFPGGEESFKRYISKKMQYPEIARLIGINGMLRVSFVVDEHGFIKDATPTNCIGAGCEAEAVKVLEASIPWIPGIQNGRPVRVKFTIPINFWVDKKSVAIKELRKSDYGFIFNIKGNLYTIDEAAAILGKSFESDQVEIAQPFYNYNNTQKFKITGKKEVYLLIFKST